MLNELSVLRSVLVGIQHNFNKSRMSQQNKKSNQNRNPRQNPRASQSGGMKVSRACGDEEALGTNVFDYGQLNKMNQFNKTLEAIISHIGRTYTQSGNIISSIRSGGRIALQGP